MKLESYLSTFNSLSSFYLQEGFLHLENIVGKSIIEWKSGQELIDLQVSVRQLPYPEFRSNEFLVAAAGLLPFVLVLSLIYSAGIFTKVQCVYMFATLPILSLMLPCLYILSLIMQYAGAGIREGKSDTRATANYWP